MRRKYRMFLAIMLIAACVTAVPVAAGVFEDTSGHWAETYITQAAEMELVQGYNGLYRPDDSMTRAEFVTVLWRAMGEPEPTKETTFTDLAQEWYRKPVAWAQENNMINGVAEEKFDPNGTVTREQLVVILHRMAGTPIGQEIMFTAVYDWQYPDSGQISAYAKQALYWSIFNEIYCGEDMLGVGKTLAPKSAASRAQIAVMITRYLNREN